MYLYRSNVSITDHHYGTTPPETIVSYTETIEGIAYDWVHKILYMTNTGNDSIELITMTGRHRKTIIDDNLYSPRGIAVDPRDDQNWIYWTDWGNKAKIERAHLDGSSRALVVATNIIWPNHLTIDYADDRLFWTDGKLDSISSCDLDGKNVQVVYSDRSSTQHPFGITIFEKNVYWSDWRSNGIYQGDKKNGTSDPTKLATFINQPFGVKVYHETRQPKGNHLII